MITGLIIGFVIGFICAMLFARFVIKKTMKSKPFTGISDIINSIDTSIVSDALNVLDENNNESEE